MHIEYHVEHRGIQIALVVGAICFAALLAIETVHSVLPSMLAASDNIATVQTALRIDDANDRIQNRLGLLYFWSDLDITRALPLLHRAVQQNPYQAQYHLDLGTVCEAAGDADCAARAFMTAASLAPRTPRFQLALANHYLVTAHKPEALNALHSYLELQPQHTEPVLQNFLRAMGDPNPIWNVLPQQSDHDLQLSFIALLSQNHDFQDANLYWAQVVQSGARIGLAPAAPYLSALEGNSQFAQMTSVWRELQNMNSVPSAEPGNLLSNGGFESDPTNAGLDWRVNPQKYVELSFADTTAHSGRRSLSVNFAVESNLEFDLLDQIVPVSPNSSYTLSAFVQSKAITSDAGPQLRVQDLLCPTCLDVTTAGTLGSTPWHQVSTTFTTGANSHFLRLSLWRPRSRTYPSEISGQFWIDNVRLQESPR